MIFLSNFHPIRPPFESSQLETFEWLLDAHCRSELTKGTSDRDVALFRSALKEKLFRVGCRPEFIEKRGHILPDFFHREWEKMHVYRLTESASGMNLSVRSKLFEEHADKIFDAYYHEKSSPPDHLIHVSCTGYISPSSAQKIVSRRNWGAQTTVTHAYHMGCYGAFPAIRMGMGFLQETKMQTDIVHTEMCSLHSNPSLHETDQIVSQSLFADGFIKYTLSKLTQAPCLKVMALYEEIIPDSSKSMTWNVADWGFQMSLAKEIPVLISRALEGYLRKLCAKASIENYAGMLFAIHPGGPKILKYIQDLLSLSDAQMRYSFEILKKYGNMSSATLPHIWEAILSDKEAKDQTRIVSLAFGPGLSISGAIMEKSCGS